MRNFTVRAIFSFVLIMVLLSGCATIVSKSHYPITISSSPSNAELKIVNSKGEIIFSGNAPVSLTLKSSAGFFRKARYMVEFKMEGYRTDLVPIVFSIDGWYFGNILFGGWFGLLIVDPLTGAMWRLKDPYLYHQMTSRFSTSTDEPQLQVLEIGDIPEDWKTQLVRIR